VLEVGFAQLISLLKNSSADELNLLYDRHSGSGFSELTPFDRTFPFFQQPVMIYDVAWLCACIFRWKRA
jgi:hypothetical protein